MPDVAEPPTTQSDYSDAFAGIDAISGVDAPPPEPAAVPAATSEPEPQAEPAPEPAPVTRQKGLLDEDLPSRPAPKPPEPPKPAPVKPAPTAPVAAPKPKPETNGHKPAAGSDEFKTPAALRAAYAETKAERDKLNTEIAEARKQIEAAKKSGEEAAEARHKQELETLKKEREELESTVRFTDFTKSVEYRTKYREPINKLWDKFDVEVKDFKIDTDQGEVAVTREHMWELIRMNAMQAARVASEKFGAAAPEILNFRRQLRDLHEQKDAAVEEWRTKGSELAAKQAKDAEERSKNVHSFMENEVKTVRTGRSDLFLPDPNDPEEKKKHEETTPLIEAAFYGRGKPSGATPEEWQETILKAQARVMARAANFGVLAHRNDRQRVEIEALNEKLSKYEKSEPGAGDPGRVVAAKPTDMSFEDGIDALPGI